MVTQSEFTFATPQRNRETLKSLKNVIVHVFTSKLRRLLSTFQENEASSAPRVNDPGGSHTSSGDESPPGNRSLTVW